LPREAAFADGLNGNAKPLVAVAARRYLVALTCALCSALSNLYWRTRAAIQGPMH